VDERPCEKAVENTIRLLRAADERIAGRFQTRLDNLVRPGGRAEALRECKETPAVIVRCVATTEQVLLLDMCRRRADD